MSILRKADPESENLIPTLSSIYFTKEKYCYEAGCSVTTHVSMLEFEDEWKVVGRAYADDVRPSDAARYVVLFEDSEGYQFWCHCASIHIEMMARKVQADPSRIASRK
jgi:hypothetical protein